MNRAEKLGLGIGAAGFAALFLYSMRSAGAVTIQNLSNPDDAVNPPKPTGSPKVGAVRGNNPGNLRYIDPSRAWNGQIGNNAGFGIYDTPANGVRALWKQIVAYKLNTVRAIVTKFAPPSENPTEAYIAFVCKRIGVSDTQTLELSRYRVPMTQAIMRFELGFEAPYTVAEVDRWTNS